MAYQRRKIKVPASSTAHSIRYSSTYAVKTDTFSISVRYISSTQQEFGALEFDFSGGEFDSLNAQDIYSANLLLYTQKLTTPSPIEQIDVAHVSSGTNLSSYTATTLWDAIAASTTDLASPFVSGDAKSLQTISLDTSVIDTAITNGQKLILAIRKSSATEGEGQIGGQTMAQGLDTLWRESNSTTELSDPPTLELELLINEESHLRYLLKYTSQADPSANQNTPSSSVGGYLAPNEINNSAQILNNTTNSQETISVSTLPSDSSGLVQIGPEVMSYTGRNIASNEITGVTRSTVPNYAYASNTLPYAEYLHYIRVDDLFDNNPTTDLVQYRCVGLQQQGISSIVNATGVKVFLVQNQDSNVTIDIGIEVPKFDKHEGSFLSEVTDESLNEFFSNSADVTDYPDGYFNGAHIIIDYDSAQGLGPLHHVIDSYEYDSGTGNAVFFLEDNLPDPTPAGTLFRIMPAPSQTIVNEVTPPTENSGRFFGFFGEGGSNDLGFGSVREQGATTRNYDHFYIWIKRTFSRNQRASSDSAAVIIVQYTT